MNQEQHQETNGGTATAPVNDPPRSGQYYRPMVDIVEQPDELLLVADMPGVSADSVDIDFEDGELKILGRVPQRQGDGIKQLHREYGVGDFYRVFQIDEAIDPTRISADYANGVLTVHLP